MSFKPPKYDEQRHYMAPFFAWMESFLRPFKPPATLELPSHLFGFIWHFLSQAKKAFGLAIALGIAHGVLEALVIMAAGQLVDVLSALESEQRSWAALQAYDGGWLFGLFIVLIGVRILIMLASAINEEQFLVPGFFTQTRWQIHQSVMRQSLSYFQNDLSGRLASKVFQSGQLIGDTILKAVSTLLFIAVFMLSSIGLLVSLDGRLVIVAVIWIILIGIFAYMLVPQIRYHAKVSAESAATASGRLVDSYSNIASVKLYAPDDPFVRQGLASHFHHLKLFSRVLTRLRGGNAVINGIMFSITLYYAVDLWIKGSLSTGEVTIVVAFAMRLQMMSNRILGNLNALFRYLGNIENTMNTVAKAPELIDAQRATDLAADYPPKSIHFDQVSFGYNQKSAVLHQIDFKINAGERVGIVGLSGAGKSTIFQLLLRFFEPSGGAVCIDGVDIRRYSQSSYRRLFSLVQQDATLLNRSIRDNVAYGRKNISEAEIWSALNKADASEFVKAIVDRNGAKGIDAMVGERGVKLSGGQRQRIHVARLFLRDAPILLLDEATSQLDSQSEGFINDQLDALANDKTLIAIAHRLSTIERMDRLLLVHQGQLIAQGDHQSLYAKQELYKQLWDAQNKNRT